MAYDRDKTHSSGSTNNRWNSDGWFARDIAALSAVYGPIPLNHLKREASPQTAFVAWLNAVLKPETVEHVMSTSVTYAQCYSIFRALAEYQRNNSKNHNPIGAGSDQPEIN